MAAIGTAWIDVKPTGDMVDEIRAICREEILAREAELELWRKERMRVLGQRIHSGLDDQSTRFAEIINNARESGDHFTESFYLSLRLHKVRYQHLCNRRRDVEHLDDLSSPNQDGRVQGDVGGDAPRMAEPDRRRRLPESAKHSEFGNAHKRW